LATSKEEYLSSMNHLTMAKRKREEKAVKKRELTNSDDELPSPNKPKDAPMSRNPFDLVDKAF
jgi:hypothetical protein